VEHALADDDVGRLGGAQPVVDAGILDAPAGPLDRGTQLVGAGPVPIRSGACSLVGEDHDRRGRLGC
jgi:hypothetical protein